MTTFDAILQGVVQGLTEFLPVSSSGHLSLVQYFTGQGGETGAFFSILLHGGTLIAVVLAFWKTIATLLVEGIYMLWDIVTFKFSVRHISKYQRMILMLLLATLPLFVFVLFKDFFQGLATDRSILVEGVCFLGTSALLFLSDACTKGRKSANSITARDAVCMGMAQGVALLPGISRSGSTISTGLLCGLDRKFAVEFSFIMGIPAVVGAIILEIKDVMATPVEISNSVIVAGLISSVVCGVLAIKMVNWLVSKNKFKYFAWYTLILGIAVVALALWEMFMGNTISSYFISLFA